MNQTIWIALIPVFLLVIGAVIHLVIEVTRIHTMLTTMLEPLFKWWVESFSPDLKDKDGQG